MIELCFSSSLTHFLLFLFGFVNVHTRAIDQSDATSRIKLFYQSKKADGQIFVEAKENLIMFCDTRVSFQ